MKEPDPQSASESRTNTVFSSGRTEPAPGLKDSADQRAAETKILSPDEADVEVDDEPTVEDGFLLAPDALTGTTIGPYQVVSRIGRGGFGDVYRAEQTAPIRRSVALKVLKPGMATEAVIRRFEAERQALARMNHSGIARVFDAGVTTDGRNYFVMELVHGSRITTHADNAKLDIRQRVQLFIKVCQAIEHAHQHGIAHRDIKPSNILVGEQDGEPTPRIIDFGIAKALEEPLTEFAIKTQTYEVLGTPRYMSPEQTGFAGMEVDHRTDIYSLGVVLYELIVGETPFLRETEKLGAPMGWITVIREQEPPRPSTQVMRLGDVAPNDARSRGVTEARGLARLLAEDLDWIILRCLEKDRDHRYASAAALAEDLQRFLDQRPIVAIRQGPMYRFRKLLRRRRDLVRLALVFGAVLAIVTVASFALWRSAVHETKVVTLREDITTAQALIERQPALASLPFERRRNDLRAWLASADNVLSRKAQSIAARDEVKAAINDPAIASSELRDLSTAALQQRLDDAERLVEVLTSLEAADGPRGKVQSWLDRSPSPEEIEHRWERAAPAINMICDIRQIPDRTFVVPLSLNRTSNLWEFADLQLGLEPARDADGVYKFDAETGVIFVLIPGATFTMGTPPDELGRKRDEDLHDVTLSPYLVSKYEITQGQWIRAMDALPGSDDRLDYPVGGVTWVNAAEFCRRTNCLLPSEAQWECACRAGSALPFSGANEMDELGWYEVNSGESRQRVGQKLPNAFGLFDMHGNALEWCQDVYSAEFYSSDEGRGLDPIHDPELDPKLSPVAERIRVLRGGSYTSRGHERDVFKLLEIERHQ